MQDLESRIDRQERIKGWNQDALDKAKVILVGSGPLCHFVATGLTGLGVGSTRIIDNSRFNGLVKNEFLYYLLDSKDYLLKKESKAYALRDILSKMNNRIEVEGIHSIFIGQFAKGDVIADLTNNPDSKSRSMKYAMEHRIPYISASTDYYRAVGMSYDPKEQSGINEDDFLHLEFRGKQQGSSTSGVIGGVVIDEIRRAIFRLNENDKMLTRRICYNILSDERFLLIDNYQPIYSSYRDKKVAVVGAGALGNFVGIHLALLGAGKIAFIDYDTISSSNLNRQPCFTFYDSVGKKKVDVITDVLRRINPQIEFEGIDRKIVKAESELSCEDRRKGIKPFDLNYLLEFDLVMSCGDNPDVRLTLNDYIGYRYISRNIVISLVDGGTDSTDGNVAVYFPGKNACIDSQIGYSNFPRAVIRNSCIADEHAPSVVYVNLITASVMCGEVLFLLNPKIMHTSIKEPILYKSLLPDRFVLKKDRSERCEICK